MAKFIAILLSLAAGPISHTCGGVGAASIPRLAEVSTALVLINAPSRAWALGTYSVPTAAPTAPPTEKCGPCGDTIELDLDEPYDIQSNTCYEIAGEFPTKDVAIPPEVSCAKITVKEGAAVDNFFARSGVPKVSPVPRNDMILRLGRRRRRDDRHRRHSRLFKCKRLPPVESPAPQTL